MLRSFDSFCADNFPGAALLSQEMVWTWMERTSMPRSGRVVNGSVIRKFAIYMNGIGGDAYILPEKMYGSNASFVPYIFTDDELQQLFMEIDAICPSAAQPYKHVVLPVMFRMIYTCGLRPTEARLLRTDNVYLESGEVLITGTKRNRDRIIVMSEDMRTLCADYNEQRRFFGSSRKVRETNREEPNEHKEETVISVAISKALGNFNLVIESLKFTC